MNEWMRKEQSATKLLPGPKVCGHIYSKYTKSDKLEKMVYLITFQISDETTEEFLLVLFKMKGMNFMYVRYVFSYTLPIIYIYV